MANGSKHGNKELQVLNINKESREMLRSQAEEKNITISSYVERLVLEKEVQRKQGKTIEGKKNE